MLAINEEGEIVRSLQEPSGEHLKEITSAREHDGYLYLGSLHNDRIGKYKLEYEIVLKIICILRIV
ncbi:MAG: hypothetical protein R6V76_12700 [Desulfobacterales bacterium]